MYQLMNKDRVILSFVAETMPYGDIVSDIQQVASVLPVGLHLTKLRDWLLSRRAPYHREHMAKLIEIAKVDDLSDYLDTTLALSLNDTLWVKKSDSNLTFSDVNLYDNEFNGVVASFALTGESSPTVGSSALSPEFSTSGRLAKCWSREQDGTIFLHKAGTVGAPNAGREPHAEFLASQLLDRLGFNHARYDLKTVSGILVSTCPLFTSKKIGYTPVRLLAPITDFYLVRDYYSDNGWEDSFSELVVLDALIGNTARHMSNFGILTDTDTYTPIRPAPIFDNGFGLFSLGDFQSLEEAVKSEYLRKPSLYRDFVSMAHESLTPATRKAVMGLRNFKFVNHPTYPIEPKRLDILNKVITFQASRILMG